jgi:hypothetical protein
VEVAILHQNKNSFYFNEDHQFEHRLLVAHKESFAREFLVERGQHQVKKVLFFLNEFLFSWSALVHSLRDQHSSE